MVERTFAHLNQMQRLAVRYERRAEIYHAFFTLGCTLLAFRHLMRSRSECRALANTYPATRIES